MPSYKGVGSVTLALSFSKNQTELWSPENEKSERLGDEMVVFFLTGSAEIVTSLKQYFNERDS